MVRDGMTPVLVTVGTSHSLRDAARRMTQAGVGAAVVLDPDLPAPAIITERDVLHCAGEDGDLDAERVGDHLTARPVFAAPDWPLERAANEMSAGGFRHVIVIEGSHVLGILSMRDIVRCWIGAGTMREASELAATAR
jgi:signal-transduction protein with cAMP-binding, CBS, and nucleotidyltransferase domain